MEGVRFFFTGKMIGYCVYCECWTCQPIEFSVPADKIAGIVLEEMLKEKEKENDIKTDG